MSKFFITGGAGYVGAILVGDLLEQGHKVTVLDNFAYRQNSLANHFINPNLEVHVGDCRDADLIRKISADAEWIIPLAAIVGAPACRKDPIAARSINIDAQLALFNISSSDQKIIMPTTNSAYGTTKPGTWSTEESILNPISEYAQHKVEVEKALMVRGNSTSFRLATVFGMSPRMRLDLLVNDLVYRAINDRSVVLFEGDFVRNFIHVKDVSSAIRHAVENWDDMRNEIYNVGLTSANLSKRELCLQIGKMVPNFKFVESDVGMDPDQRNYQVSNEKIESTGWKPSITLEVGINELIKGLRTLNNRVYGNV